MITKKDKKFLKKLLKKDINFYNETVIRFYQNKDGVSREISAMSRIECDNLIDVFNKLNTNKELNENDTNIIKRQLNSKIDFIKHTINPFKQFQINSINNVIKSI